MAKATIQNIYGATPRTKDGKTLYAFSVLLSDGEKGNTNFFETNDALKVGQEIDYEIQEKNGFRNIVINKPKKPRSGGGAQRDYKKEAVFVALQEATKYWQHRGGRDTEEITRLAETNLVRLHKQLDACK